MKDDAIRRRPAERDALTEARVRAFCLTNAQLRAAEQTARFVENRHRIVQAARKPGPYIYGVYERDQADLAGVGARRCTRGLRGPRHATFLFFATSGMSALAVWRITAVHCK